VEGGVLRCHDCGRSSLPAAADHAGKALDAEKPATPPAFGLSSPAPKTRWREACRASHRRGPSRQNRPGQPANSGSPRVHPDYPEVASISVQAKRGQRPEASPLFRRPKPFQQDLRPPAARVVRSGGSEAPRPPPSRRSRPTCNRDRLGPSIQFPPSEQSARFRSLAIPRLEPKRIRRRAC
jgi:hypothetical protein